ncbi:MAG: Na/Pi cotransporter family protein [Clostridia bacterium]|nr:Na/Pi cotransporter family protein [Clostridia bacterium]
MEIFTSLLVVFGGLGVFLYGIKLLGDYLQNLAGNKLKTLMSKVGNNRLSTVGIGAAVTAVIQSSAVTTVMVVGFVNAGIMTLFQATGIIMGANIGTTITAQIAALSTLPVTEFFIALTGVGFFLSMCKNTKVKNAAMILLSFGMSFSGLLLMSDALGNLNEIPVIHDAFARITNPFLLFFIGLLLTAIIQSSSATTVLLITMSGEGLLALDAALFATLGVNIGTCVTALLAGIGANANAKRASVIHLLFNFFGSILFFIIVYFAPIAEVLQKMFPHAPQTQIAMFHTFFNVSTTLLLLPFMKVLTKLATLIVPDKKSDGKSKSKSKREPSSLKYVDERLLSSPSIAIEQFRRELMRMMDIACKNLDIAMSAVIDVDLSKQGEFDEADRLLSKINSELIHYLIKLSGEEVDLDTETEIATYHKAVSDVSRIDELAQNVMEYTAALRDSGVTLSDVAKSQLGDMRSALYELRVAVQTGFDNRDITDAEHVAQLEENIDFLYMTMEQSHIRRMNSGECNAYSATIFMPLINNLERIGDHIYNVFRGMTTYVKLPSKVRARKVE